MTEIDLLGDELAAVDTKASARGLWTLVSGQRFGTNRLVLALDDEMVCTQSLSKAELKTLVGKLNAGAPVDEAFGKKATRTRIDDIDTVATRDDGREFLTVGYRNPKGRSRKMSLRLPSDARANELMAALESAMAPTVRVSEPIRKLEQFFGTLVALTMTVLAALLTLSLDGTEDFGGRNSGGKDMLSDLLQTLGPLGVLAMGAALTAGVFWSENHNAAFRETLVRAPEAPAEAQPVHPATQTGEESSPLNEPMGTFEATPEEMADAARTVEATSIGSDSVESTTVETTAVPVTVGAAVGQSEAEATPPAATYAAAWYPAPDGNGQQYYDGTAWTEHRAP